MRSFRWLLVAGCGLAAGPSFAQTQPHFTTCTVVEQSATENWFRGIQEFAVRRDPDGTVVSLAVRDNGQLRVRDIGRARPGLGYDFDLTPVPGVVIATFLLVTAEAGRYVTVDMWLSGVGTSQPRQPASGTRHGWVRLLC